MLIPHSYIENYSASLNAISRQARSNLFDALMRIDYSQDVESIRESVIAIMETSCGASSSVSARLAAEFYGGLRIRFGIDDGFVIRKDSMRDQEATDGAVHAFVQDLVDGKPVDQFVEKCVERIDYETRKAANECIAANAKRDPKKPIWARVPVGIETCSFCIMLASRGFVYESDETASHAHANCDCRVVPSWDKDNPRIEGYDPEYYLRVWRRIEEANTMIKGFYSGSASSVERASSDYGRQFNERWQEYKRGGKKNEESYDECVNAFLSGITPGNLRAEHFTHLEGKEILLGKWFADSGQDVLFLRPQNDKRRNDALINGVPWEFKQISSPDPLKIKDRISDGVGQSRNIVIDISRSKITKREAVLQTAMALENEGLSTVLIAKSHDLIIMEK